MQNSNEQTNTCDRTPPKMLIHSSLIYLSEAECQMLQKVIYSLCERVSLNDQS